MPPQNFAFFNHFIKTHGIDTPDLGFDGIELTDRPWFPYLCTEVEHWHWETEGDEHFKLWLTLGGAGYLTTAGQTFRLVPGMFFIFPPRQAVVASHFSGSRVLRFSAHFHPLRGGRRLAALACFPILGGRVEAIGYLERQIHAIMRGAVRRESEAVLAGQVQRLIINLCGGGSGRELELDRRVAEAIRAFQEKPAEVGSMGTVAEGLGLSRAHFDRLFRKAVGQTPKQFLLNCKMIQARRFLESGRLRVGEIAEELGYRDVYFFSRQFKLFFGSSPTNYQRAHYQAETGAARSVS